MQLILDVVRGIEPWTVLSKLGLYGTKNCSNGTQWYFPAYKGELAFITVDDLIMGFKNHSKDMVALQEWAIFMYVADDFIDFEALENDPRGDEIKDYIWQASFREFDVPPLKQFLEKCREEKDLEEAQA